MSIVRQDHDPLHAGDRAGRCRTEGWHAQPRGAAAWHLCARAHRSCSPRDHWTILEILTAHVCQNAAWIEPPLPLVFLTRRSLPIQNLAGTDWRYELDQIFGRNLRS